MQAVLDAVALEGVEEIAELLAGEAHPLAAAGAHELLAGPDEALDIVAAQFDVADAAGDIDVDPAIALAQAELRNQLRLSAE